MLNLLNSNTVAKNTVKFNKKQAHLFVGLEYSSDEKDYWAHFITVTWQWSDDVEGFTHLCYDDYYNLLPEWGSKQNTLVERVIKRRKDVGLSLYNTLTKDVDGVMRTTKHKYSKKDDAVFTNVPLHDFYDLKSVRDVFEEDDTYSSHHGRQQSIIIAVDREDYETAKKAIAKIDENFQKFAEKNNLKHTFTTWKRKEKKAA
jgi:hypothetical protein